MYLYVKFLHKYSFYSILVEYITLMEFTMRQVEDLFNQLENVSPGVKGLDRKKIMRACCL